MLRIIFEWFKLAFKCFESHLKGKNLHSNALSLVRMVTICIRMLRSLSSGPNLHSKASNPFRMVRISVWMLYNPFEWFEIHSNASNPFRICNQIQFALKCFEPRLKVWIWIPMLQIPFEWLEFVVERFKTLSNGSNLHSNALNPFGMVTICIRMLRIPFQMNRTWIRMLRISFEWLEFALEFFEFLLNG